MIQLVVLMSLYKEGHLAYEGFKSVLELDCPVIIYEGPAGPPLPQEVPDTDYSLFGRTSVHRGSWPSDAAKRTSMVKYAQKHWKGPLWGLWLDGDDLLVNGKWLPGILQAITDQDAVDGDPAEPVAGWPMLIIENDGSVGINMSRCLRIDLVDEYLVSSSVIRMKGGAELAVGLIPYPWHQWRKRREDAPEGWEFLRPPIPTEPFTVHRPHLRHPLRRQHRLHQAEPAELDRLGFPR